MKPYMKCLSHVGVPTSDLEASLRWYKEVMGLEEAFRLVRNDKVALVYLHLSPDTFIELFAPRPELTPPPKTHFSIEVTDIEAAVADVVERLPRDKVHRIVTGDDGSRLFNFFDPDGHRIEFQQFPPESQQARAMHLAGGAGSSAT